MTWPGRHYVEIGKKGLRPFAVRRAALVASSSGRRAATRYTTVSRHFTYRRATRRAQILNAREGHAQ